MAHREGLHDVTVNCGALTPKIPPHIGTFPRCMWRSPAIGDTQARAWRSARHRDWSSVDSVRRAFVRGHLLKGRARGSPAHFVSAPRQRLGAVRPNCGGCIQCVRGCVQGQCTGLPVRFQWRGRGGNFLPARARCGPDHTRRQSATPTCCCRSCPFLYLSAGRVLLNPGEVAGWGLSTNGEISHGGGERSAFGVVLCVPHSGSAVRQTGHCAIRAGLTVGRQPPRLAAPTDGPSVLLSLRGYD